MQADILIPARRHELTTGFVMQDPEVCKLMYPYVPDNMRSPEGVQLMMSDPDIRDKLESSLQQAFKVGSLLSLPLLVAALLACLLACLLLR